MKVLIWVGCLFIYGIIQTGLTSGGIILGALPTVALFGGTCALARYLCVKYGEIQRNKTQTAGYEEKSVTSNDYASQQGITPVAEAVAPAILYCRKCGKRLVEGSDFCSYCGTPVMKG